MAEGNLKLPGEINELKKKLEQFERRNAELTRENAKLKEKDVKSMEEIEMLKKEKLQITIPIVHHLKRPHDEAGSSKLALKEETKKSKQFGNNSIPNWFHAVTDWIKRTELAQSAISHSCWAFNQYCWQKLHGNVKPHKVRELTFSHFWDDEGNSRSILRKNGGTIIPIASTNPPEYITGFEQIDFRFIDSRGLKFVQLILPLLNDVIIDFKEWRGNDARLGPIDRLMALLGPKTFKLEISAFVTTNGMDYLDEELPGLLNNVRSVWLGFCRFSDLDVLSNWLATPRDDGQKKLLEVASFSRDANGFVDQVKQEFFDSEEPTNFIVLLDVAEFPQFRMENKKTDEILELCQKQNSQNELKNLIIRHRKGDDVDKMDWEEEFGKESQTFIEIKLIGDLLECYD